MRRKLRLGLTAAFCALGLAALSAGLAWACSAQANISVNPGAGPTGTPVTVRGDAFFPGRNAVAIRWNDVDSGEVLARATGPNFVVGIHIPADASPGTHTIVAVFTGASGSQFVAREPFTVTSGSAGGTSEGDSLSTSGGAASGAPRTSGSNDPGDTQRAGPGQTSGAKSALGSSETEGSGETSGQGSGAVGGTTDAAGQTTATTSGGGARPDSGTSVTRRSRDLSGSPQEGAVRSGPVTGSDREAGGASSIGGFSGSSSLLGTRPSGPLNAGAAKTFPTGTRGRSEDLSPLSAPGADIGPGSSAQIQTGDLWSGLLSSSPRNGLARLDQAVERPNSSLLLGAGLAAAGLLTLLAGVAIATARRHRARASATSDRDL